MTRQESAIVVMIRESHARLALLERWERELIERLYQGLSLEVGHPQRRIQPVELRWLKCIHGRALTLAARRC